MFSEPSEPVPNQPWTTTVIEHGAPVRVTFDIGDKIGQDSSFFSVYDLKSEKGIPARLLSGRLGRDLVIKVFRHDSEQLSEMEKTMPGITDHPVSRMLKADAHLDAGIEHLHIVGWDDPGIVLQDRIEETAGRFETLSLDVKETVNGVDYKRPSTARERRDELGADKRAAILQLFKALMDAKLGWLDAHLGNLYLKRDGSKWVAGILDQDFIGTLDEMKQGAYAEFGEARLKDTKSPPQTMATITDVKMLQEKVLEALGWIQYSREQKRLTGGGVFEPEEIRKVIPDLPFLTAPGTL